MSHEEAVRSVGGGRRNSARLADRTGTACRADAVSKVYGRRETAVHALRDVTLDIPARAFTAIMGPSGSGKSTLLHCLAALDTPTAGHVFLGQTELTALSRRQQAQVRRDRIGFVFQAFNLVPTLDAIENITLPQLLAGRRPDREWLDHIVHEIGLADRLHHRPSELSGGQQQRVALARALAGRPEVIFADEPTGNLDTAASQEMLALLRDAVDQFAQTVITVSHDPSITRYADLVLVLRDGQVVDQASDPDVDEVSARPLSGEDTHDEVGYDEVHAPRPDGQDRMRSRRRRQPDEPTPGRPMVGSDDEVEVARQERWLQRIREQFEAEHQPTHEGDDAPVDDRDPWVTQAVEHVGPAVQDWQADADAAPQRPAEATRRAFERDDDDQGWLPAIRSWDLPDRDAEAAPDEAPAAPPAWHSARARNDVPWSRPGHPEDDDRLAATTSQWAPPDREWPPLERGWAGHEDGARDGTDGWRDQPRGEWRDDVQDRRPEPPHDPWRGDDVAHDGGRWPDEHRDAPSRPTARDADRPRWRARDERPWEHDDRGHHDEPWDRSAQQRYDRPAAPPELHERSWPPPGRPLDDDADDREGWRDRSTTDWRALRDSGRPLDDTSGRRPPRDTGRPSQQQPDDVEDQQGPPQHRRWQPADLRDEVNGFHQPDAPRRTPGSNGSHHAAPPPAPAASGLHPERPDDRGDGDSRRGGIDVGGTRPPSVDDAEDRGSGSAHAEPAHARPSATDADDRPQDTDDTTAAPAVDAGRAATERPDATARASAGDDQDDDQDDQAVSPPAGDDEIVQPILHEEHERDDGPVIPRVAAAGGPRPEAREPAPAQAPATAPPVSDEPVDPAAPASADDPQEPVGAEPPPALAEAAHDTEAQDEAAHDGEETAAALPRATAADRYEDRSPAPEAPTAPPAPPRAPARSKRPTPTDDALPAALASLRSTRRPDENADPMAALQSLQVQLDRLGDSGRTGSRRTGRERPTPRRDRD
jgi:putative ABC transport system ATP-binding protein